MTPRVLIFFDASVLLAAAGSPRGGSSAAIALIAGSDRYEAVVSGQVLREALGNLRLKFLEEALVRFYTQLGGLRPGLAQVGEGLAPQDLPASLAPKDRHVVEACLNAGANICLTLDRRHLLTDELRRWGIEHGIRFLTPGEFLAWQRVRES